MNSISTFTFAATAAASAAHIIPARLQTKEWRKNADWYSGGRKNECEKYQIKTLEEITNRTIEKTTHRLHTETFHIIPISNPMRYENGYEYTENFDGIVETTQNVFYFNLKFICDAGGAQTRSLREVYHFVKYQLEHVKQYNEISRAPYFINILEGNTSAANMDKFNYLLGKYSGEARNRVFVGDMYEFQQNLPRFGDLYAGSAADLNCNNNIIDNCNI